MMANGFISIMGANQDAVCVRSCQTKAFDGRWVEVAQHSVSSLKEEEAVPNSRFNSYDGLVAQKSGC